MDKCKHGNEGYCSDECSIEHRDNDIESLHARIDDLEDENTLLRNVVDVLRRKHLCACASETMGEPSCAPCRALAALDAFVEKP